MKKLFLILFSIATSQILFAQEEAIIREYISQYKSLAISEMQRTGVPASIKLAQGIHETFAGQSKLVLKSNNHFGIKCKSEWRGESVKHDDDASNECFRKYPSAEDSYKDHSNFLRGGERYNFLFQLKPTDYSGWAYGLKKAGYATNPKYAPIIIKLIEDYQLQEYSLIAMGQLKAPTVDLATVEIKPAIKDKMEAIVEVKKSSPVITENAVVGTITVKEIPKPVFPSGEFKLNETRVVFISKGTSFLSLAEQYAVPLFRIFEFNDMRETESSEKDQLIYLQRKRKTGNNEFHIVKPGESLHDIAQEEALRIESLLEYNFLSATNKPAVGEKLFLRSKATAPPKLSLNETLSLNLTAVKNPEQSGNNSPAPVSTHTIPQTTEHKVATKETIYSIARIYNVKIDDLVKWNNLKGYDLKIGQQLLIFKL